MILVDGDVDSLHVESLVDGNVDLLYVERSLFIMCTGSHIYSCYRSHTYLILILPKHKKLICTYFHKHSISS
jgi:hypothetical protein